MKNYEFTITGLMGAAFEILLRIGALGIEAVSFLKLMRQNDGT